MSNCNYSLHVLKQFRVCMKSRYNIMYDKILSKQVIKSCFFADASIDAITVKGY